MIIKILIYFSIWFSLAFLPILFKGWAINAKIKKESKKTPSNKRWIYNIILKKDGKIK